MKKIFLVSFLALMVVFSLWGCGMNKSKKSLDVLEAPQSKQTINLYFTDKENSKILSETREVIVKSMDQLPEIAINELLKGPVNLDMKNAIPEGTKLLSIREEDGLVIVNFSRDYYNTDDIGEIVARFSVVNTLCDLPNVDKVLILVEGKELVGPSGNELGPLEKDDAVYSPTKDFTTITLYFADSEGMYLVPEKRQIIIKDNEPVEKYIMQELIKGPKSPGLSATVPPETKVLSIETKEKVCFVNLSSEFKLQHNGGSTGEIMTIYSIVNSLTELESIDKVQFLIEGQKTETFKGHITFNEPFERDPDIIKKK
ncbi:MAG: GerMN domain-containing protein [Clostridiaceae bacterium]|nr:GerMN domain-containing protein [Clostridiaceae bacterium]